MHTAQLMPLPLAVSCLNKIQMGFTSLVPAHPGSPGKRAIERVCVCVIRLCPSFKLWYGSHIFWHILRSCENHLGPQMIYIISNSKLMNIDNTKLTVWLHAWISVFCVILPPALTRRAWHPDGLMSHLLLKPSSSSYQRQVKQYFC